MLQRIPGDGKVKSLSIEGKRVLYISYNGMLDPLGQSQVLPYLRELARKGIHFTLLSFERAQAFTPEGEERCRQLQRTLAAEGIEWHWLRYHQRPSLPATAYDVWSGVRYGSQLVRRNQIEMVHARSHIPAAIALRLKKKFGVKMIFDVRGLMGDEYVDAGHWRKDSVPYRLTKAAERRALKLADGVVTLTERIWPIIKEWEGLRNRQVMHEVVPCCANLELFKFNQHEREQRRKELGLAGKFVVVYSGSIDGWYLTEEMADFFAVAVREKPDAHLLWLTPGRRERIKSLMDSRSIAADSYTVLAADPREVSSYLSASDVGLAFIKPCFSKLASSPTKYAEYLGCGLPLIINAGVGDSDALVLREQAGALVTTFDEVEYRRVAALIDTFANNVDQTRAHTRSVAERLFDVRNLGTERYRRLYGKLLADTSQN